MANKQEKAIQRAVKRAEKRGIMREEKHVLVFLIFVILFLLWLLFAQHNGWWPYSRPTLGSAFYTNLSANTPAPATDESTGSSDDSDNDNSNGSTGNSGSNGSNGSNGSDGDDGSDDDDTTTSPASSSLLDFAGEVNVGDTRTEISAKADNLGKNCAVVADVKTQTIGKQEVCTYTEGDKIITVTYLNDRVISASKSGF